jgi:hypothetical protein
MAKLEKASNDVINHFATIRDKTIIPQGLSLKYFIIIN